MQKPQRSCREAAVRQAKPVLTIRINGETDSVVVDGVEFDRSKMSKNDKYLMRRVIVDTLFRQPAAAPRRGR